MHYTSKGIHDLLIKTNLANMMVMDDEYENQHEEEPLRTKEINLSDHN